MSATLLDGKALGLRIEDSLVERVASLKSRGVEPHLAVVLAGDDAASHVYVRNKQRACERCGIKSTRIDLPSDVSQEELMQVVNELNSDDSIHGILVQSPTPPSTDELSITEAIDPSKDVDGFHPMNLGRLVMGQSDGLLPCTPAGVMAMIDDAGINLQGAKAVVIGRSRIVGMPLALMLAQKGIDATVTIAHSRTKDAAEICREADLVVAAIGRPTTVKADWIKPGATVIDVGINRINDESRESGSRLAGDVDPEAAQVAGYMTPVPGGVGPMTIAMLMTNTVRAAEMILE
ncbi:MAG TPA: bifunctional methylenetetrahydrofolate dehydrogenase/methenyltetrahydrofolate cyclohydrolase FolD [Candidatus Thalassarchaeaceae archaeon]|nr:MAG TPA: bifunctional methylenetetrahydrofolate dehydrogenase/methenyltetrahydrofolate cyclohydrolase FolD [Candidatus Poseidoniales archaeon]HIH80133.1 bifunctional methylenetetrahydrofolate dehydrogenase/methenyltetrahydrofolate cyclohydrolase FolD [Candidatus Thalassarchaeaceae archaeon]HJM30022.1 bifunctional methylenetetrahydrofolate dehydrogenase/methenyltetrahydrofolate cyclohydrolase FolD [Candidatus Thalassarchaeaceae archaeon]